MASDARLAELNREGLECLWMCLLEDFHRTNDGWYLTEAERVVKYIEAHHGT